MAQIDTLTNVGAVVSTDLALILRGGANVLGTLGSMVGQNSTAVTITGGTINGTVIGGITAAAGSFTTLVATIGTFADVALTKAQPTLSLNNTGGNSYSIRTDVNNMIMRSVTAGTDALTVNYDGSITAHVGITATTGTFSGGISAGRTTITDAGLPLVLNNASAGQLVEIGFQDAGVYKWGIDKNTDNTFGIYNFVRGGYDLSLSAAGAATFSGNVGVGSTPTAWLDVAKNGNNTGNQFRVYDEEGTAPAIRTYTVSDLAGTLINSYYAVGGAPYVRYSDFVANNADSVATTMRFITKNAANVYSTGLTLNDSGAATFSGNVGIGDTTFAAGKLQVYDSSGNHVWLKGRAGDGTSSVSFRNNADNTYNGRIEVADTGGMLFQVAGETRATLSASGNLLVGTSATPSATQGGFEIRTDAAGGGSTYLYNSSGTYTGVFDQFSFFNGNGIVGKISTDGSATTYATSSDYRLKEDAVPMIGATERVKALRPINFAWKVDGSRTDGFFAHEAQEVVPECATGTKDAMRDEKYEVTPAVEEVRDEEGNVTTEAVAAVMGTRSVPDYQGIDQSKLVPLLTAALQEAIAKIEALTARIEALEGAK